MSLYSISQLKTAKRENAAGLVNIVRESLDKIAQWKDAYPEMVKNVCKVAHVLGGEIRRGYIATKAESVLKEIGIPAPTKTHISVIKSVLPLTVCLQDAKMPEETFNKATLGALRQIARLFNAGNGMPYNAKRDALAAVLEPKKLKGILARIQEKSEGVWDYLDETELKAHLATEKVNTVVQELSGDDATLKAATERLGLISQAESERRIKEAVELALRANAEVKATKATKAAPANAKETVVLKSSGDLPSVK